MTVRPLLVCGGSGTRLWPISTDLVPKQLHSFGGGETLLQAAAARVSSGLFDPPIIITRESFADSVAEQIAAIGIEPHKILLEPVARSTAAAIGAAALSELMEDRDPILLAMPTDHIIGDVGAFIEPVKTGLPTA